jgi:hypothetical protein
VNPSAREIPFDSVDQDCDGNDAAPLRDSFPIGAGAVGRPWAAATATGFLVVWVAGDGAEQVLRAKALDPAGEPAGPEVELDRWPGADPWLDDLRIVSGRTGALVHWFRWQSERCAIVVSDAGVPVAPAEVAPGNFFQGMPATASWLGDGWGLAWVELDQVDSALFFQAVAPEAVPGPVRAVGAGESPSLGRTPGGDVLLARAGWPSFAVERLLDDRTDPLLSREGWRPVLSPGTGWLSYVTAEGIALLEVETGAERTLPANEVDFLHLADDGPTPVLAWSGLTPETYANPNSPHGRAFHLTVLEPGEAPRTLDLLAEAHEPLLGGVAVRDGRALVVWKPGLEPVVRGTVVPLHDEPSPSAR